MKKVLLVFATRPEVIESETVKLLGTHSQTIIEEAQKLLGNKIEYEGMSKAPKPYWDGKACNRIVDFIGNNI